VKTPLAIRSFANAAAWEVWLAANQETSPGIWLRIAKKASERKSVSHPEALDVAICYGWIDGQRKSADDESFLQKFTPRGKRSIWSKINREKVDALIAAGRMQPAGKREVERAKADGRWEAAYDGQRTATVPDDLAAALAGHRAAGDRGPVQRQLAGGLEAAGRIHLDGAVGNRRALVDGQRAAGHHFQHVVGGDGLAVQRIADAGDVDGAGIAERAVLQDRAAGEIDLASVGNDAAIDGRGSERKLRT